MPDLQGRTPDFLQGNLPVSKVDQGDGTYAPRMAIGSPGGTKVWGHSTFAGPVTLRAADSKRKKFVGKNKGPGLLYIGGAGTTTADGLEIGVGETFSLSDSIDAIGADASASLTIHWLEERNP